MKRLFFLIAALFVSVQLVWGVKVQNYQNLSDGEYLIQCENTGLHIGRGANYGTRAVMKTFARLHTVTNTSDQKFTIKSHDYYDNKGWNIADINSVYLDQSTLTEWRLTEEGKLYSPAKNWYLKCGENNRDCLSCTEDESEASVFTFTSLDEATKKLDAGSDATFFIKRPDFEYNHYDLSSSQTFNAWQSATFASISNQDQLLANGGYTCVENYHSAFDSYQEVVLPAGKYTLSVRAFCRLDEGSSTFAYLYAGSDAYGTSKVDLPQKTSDHSYPDSHLEACEALYSGSFAFTLIVTFESDGVVKTRFGIKCETDKDWVAWTDFSLTMTEKDTPATEPTKVSLEDGDYLIQEVSTGYYLGGGNTWGTHSSLIKHAGIYSIEKSSNGYYYMDSHTYNAPTYHYLNGLYVDGSETEICIYSLTTLSDGYAIGTNMYNLLKSQGVGAELTITSSQEEASGFRFIKYSDAVANLANATNDSPIDATFLIKAPNFSKNHYASTTDKAWTTSGVTISPAEDGSDKLGNLLAESHNSSGGFDAYQILSDAPAGLYSLTAQGVTSRKGDAKVYAVSGDNSSSSFMCQNTYETKRDVEVGFTGGNCTLAPLSIVVTSGNTLKIGAKGESSSAWVLFDNFELNYYGPYTSTQQITIGDAGCITYYSGTSCCIQGAEVYALSKDEDTSGGISMKFIPLGGVIPANTGVVIKGTPNASYDLLPCNTASVSAASDLEGVLTDTAQDSNYTYYTLDVVDGQLAFREYDSSCELKANKAFYKIAK